MILEFLLDDLNSSDDLESALKCRLAILRKNSKEDAEIELVRLISIEQKLVEQRLIESEKEISEQIDMYSMQVSPVLYFNTGREFKPRKSMTDYE